MTLPRKPRNQPEDLFLIQDRNLFLDQFDGYDYLWTPHKGVAWGLSHAEALLHLRTIKRQHPSAKLVRR